MQKVLSITWVSHDYHISITLISHEFYYFNVTWAHENISILTSFIKFEWCVWLRQKDQDLQVGNQTLSLVLDLGTRQFLIVVLHQSFPSITLSVQELSVYLDTWKSKYTAMLAFKPTGWTHSQSLLSLASIRPRRKGPVTLYGEQKVAHTWVFSFQH